MKWSSAIPEDREHQLPDGWRSAEFILGKRTRMFPYHALLLGFWSKLQYPRFISSDNEIQEPFTLKEVKSIFTQLVGNRLL
jgi:hypothetical protein